MFKTYQEKLDDAYKLIAKHHFGEIIDWNIQTTMFEMLVPLVKEIDESYLKSLGKWDDITDVSIQLEDAILAAMLNKGITFNSDVILTLNDLLKKERTKELQQKEINKKFFDVKEIVIKLTDEESKEFPDTYCDACKFLNDKFWLGIDEVMGLKKINGNNQLVQVTYIK